MSLLTRAKAVETDLISDGDLLARLHVAEVDLLELDQLLSAHFTLASGISSREVRYSRGHSEPTALFVRYGSGGALSSIEAGEALTIGDVEELESKIVKFLIKPAGEQVGQMIMFGHVPTKGSFRYRDRFQLIPVPDDAPQAPFIGAHPLIVQFRFPKSEDFSINVLRRSCIGREIELLCVALTTMIWRSASHVAHHHWVLRREAGQGHVSEYLQEGYTYNGANGLAEAFSDIATIPQLELKPTNEYYAQYGITIEQAMDLPADFGSLLDCFYGASREDKERFLRASYWFQHAQLVSTLSRSASYMALASVIESLMPPAEAAAACGTCKRSMGRGPTLRFIEFLSTYAPTVNKSNRRKLYSLRSTLTHGGALLHADLHGFMGGMTGKGLDEWSNERELWQIVRVAMVNWLLARNSITSTKK